ncbi:MAG: CRISPR-associated protein Cas1 [Gemmatimonadetes bacterium]|nr:CRISPR-associated protein Cas1 [Gemmatimonadota bacterium]
MTILYLTEAGSSLLCESQTLVVRVGGELRARVPVRGVERVVVQAPVMLSSPALALCARSQVEVVLSVRGVMARIGASEQGVELRSAQLRRAGDGEFCLRVARAVVQGKVRNQRRLLTRFRGLAPEAVDAARAAMERTLARACEAASIASLRGLEGLASAAYFRAMRLLLNPEFGFRARNRRPPRDAANALLSFAYTLVTSEAALAAAAAGLDPCIGFFHRARAGRPALALDLVEEMRSPAADSFVLKLTGRGMVRPAQFRRWPDGGVRMSRRARRSVLAAFEKKMTAPFRGSGGEPTSLRDAMRRQATGMGGAVLTGGGYAPFQLA